MNKKDVLILVALFGLWLLWGPIDRHFIKPTFFPDPPAPAVVEPDPAGTGMTREVEPVAELAPVEPAQPPVWSEREPVPDGPDETVEPDGDDAPDGDESLVELETEALAITFSSRGGTLRTVTLKAYPERNEADSGPIVMDFSGQPGLAMDGIAGLTPRHSFNAEPLADGHGARFTTTLASGLDFERTIRLVDDYLLEVRDTFAHTRDEPLRLPAYGVRTGRMEPMPGASGTYGVFALGVDTLLTADTVKRWAKDLNNRWLDDDPARIVVRPLGTAVDWVAVKNKYFVQSLRPRSQATENCVVFVESEALERRPAAVWAELQLPEAVLQPGVPFVREFEFYVGPQKIDTLSALGYHQDRIMELGWAPIRFFARMLMVGLTALYGVFGNYGVAIMLLTVIIRIVFWPLTHKGTESMRRMQELSPLMKSVNEKYKDDAQKRQQAIMALYKEHKVNPLGGCLPMLVQIPVFIGLFYLLRTAIDLRFAEFLWIKDLSEPEGLLADVLPMPLNILPIFMAITMFLQQKLTPTASGGDERQQQMQMMMMRVMPVMMLVLLYNFASGLALYWSTQNVLMIVQQVLYRRRRARQQAAGTLPAAPASAAAPQRTSGQAGRKGKRK